MNIFILICTILIPVIMISIGLLYRYNSYKKINTIFDLIIPIASLFSGLSDDENTTLPNIIYFNKKSSLIWIISGLFTLFFSIIILILKKLDIYNTSIALLEAECLILVIIFTTIHFFLKRKSYK